MRSAIFDAAHTLTSRSLARASPPRIVDAGLSEPSLYSELAGGTNKWLPAARYRATLPVSVFWT
jgi:hypothetical protein